MAEKDISSDKSTRDLVIRMDERVGYILKDLAQIKQTNESQKNYCNNTVTAFRKEIQDNGKEIQETAIKIRNEINGNVSSIKKDIGEIKANVNNNGHLTGKDKSLVYVAAITGVFAVIGIIVQMLRL